MRHVIKVNPYCKEVNQLKILSEGNTSQESLEKSFIPPDGRIVVTKFENYIQKRYGGRMPPKPEHMFIRPPSKDVLTRS
jgi:hypothetical protein